MKVWIVEEVVPYEQGHLIAVCATEEIANAIAAQETYQDYVCVYDEDVREQMPEPVKPKYQPQP